MIISKTIFFRVFGYERVQLKEQRSDKNSKVVLNLIKGAGYIPVVGVVANLSMMGLASVLSEHSERSGQMLFWSLRATGSIVSPVLIPVDVAASIWRAFS